MFATTIQIQSLLQIIRGKIQNLPIKTVLKSSLLEDIDLAISSFNSGNIITVINSVGVIVDKVLSKLKTCCDEFTIAPLLADINLLQQILIEIPLSGASGPSGPQGATGATGPQGATGPSVCPPTGNLLFNGDFEESTTTLLGWTAVNAAPITSPPSSLFSGNVVADLGNPNVSQDALISQTMPITSTCPLQLTFAASVGPAGPQLFVDVLCDSTTLLTRKLTTLGSGYYTFIYLIDNISPSCTSVTVQFRKIGAGTAQVDLVNLSRP